MKRKKIDIICVGEVLIDMIGDKPTQNLAQAKSFSKYIGGSPTNVAKNLAQLGYKSILIASIGDDNYGRFIQKELAVSQLNSKFISVKKHRATSLIKVSRTLGTPEFLAYRQADMCIEPNQIPAALLEDSKIFHTTCFALSKNPAQTTILQKAEEAFNKGCQLSIDLNYAQKIWGNTAVLPVLKAYCQYQPFVKLSDDDAFRIFGKNLSNQEVFDFFIGLGAKLICLTKGKEGAYVYQKDEETIFQAAPKIDKAVDVTGAGDAFWSGFLAGYLKGLSVKKCLRVGNNLVAKKIQHIGGLPKLLNVKDILTDKT